jgi:hypothetical protein
MPFQPFLFDAVFNNEHARPWADSCGSAIKNILRQNEKCHFLDRSLFMGFGLAVSSLVDLRLFWRLECIDTLNW